MPRIRPPTGLFRTVLDGPETSAAREKQMRIVRQIELSENIESLLATPTWSVASLLPPKRAKDQEWWSSEPAEPQVEETAQAQAQIDQEITKEKLHHLLKLSALPPPQSELEEQDMLADLRDQVHFVKEIQKIDTTDVEPLVAIRDETSEHRKEQTITQDTLAEFIALEEKKGRNGTIRRKKDTYQVTSFSHHVYPWREDPIKWGRVEDPWATGEGAESRKMGKFFFVKKKQAAEKGKDIETKSGRAADKEDSILEQVLSMSKESGIEAQPGQQSPQT